MDFGKGELQREFEVNSRSKENTERAKEQLRQSAHRGTEMAETVGCGIISPTCAAHFAT